MSTTGGHDHRWRDSTHSRGRDPVPVVVPLFRREADTERMLEQLARVTDGYSLILVNNGFDAPALLEDLGPEVYIENSGNLGLVRAVNQGLDSTAAPYVCVLHSDLLIFEEGWLENVLEFLDSHEDVGLVGFAGYHSISEEGAPDPEGLLVNHRGQRASARPTRRFSEVAAIDGLGWVMRNVGLRLDEGLGMMHFYDLDLSMQYIQRGYRIYVCGAEIYHLALESGRSGRSDEAYLSAVGGNDEDYYRSVRERFRSKWQQLLPISRGCRDEAYFRRVEELKATYRELEAYALRLESHVAELERELDNREREIEKASRHIRHLESAYAEMEERQKRSAGEKPQ